MKPRLFFWTVSLLVVLVASACASAATSVPATPPPTAESISAATALPEATAASSVDVQAVATSRGPDLEATDPTTVNLASGQLQLVEFFRFT